MRDHAWPSPADDPVTLAQTETYVLQSPGCRSVKVQWGDAYLGLKALL